MVGVKQKIIDNLCYKDLVYGQINKKLSLKLTNEEIESFIDKLFKKTDGEFYTKKGKNYYVINSEKISELQ